jgi:hypothetical protein
LGIWGLLLLASWQQAIAHTGNLSQAPNWLMSQLCSSNGLLIGSIAALFCGIYLLYLAGHQVKKESNQWA